MDHENEPKSSQGQPISEARSETTAGATAGVAIQTSSSVGILNEYPDRSFYEQPAYVKAMQPFVATEFLDNTVVMSTLYQVPSSVCPVPRWVITRTTPPVITFLVHDAQKTVTFTEALWTKLGAFKALVHFVTLASEANWWAADSRSHIVIEKPASSVVAVAVSQSNTVAAASSAWNIPRISAGVTGIVAVTCVAATPLVGPVAAVVGGVGFLASAVGAYLSR